MNDRIATSRSRLQQTGKTDLSDAFPGAGLYRGMRILQTGVVREAAPLRDFFPFSERHLQSVWADSSWRPDPLKSRTGEDVVVEHPGRWNLEAGPDFLDAVVRVGPGSRRLQGDVEVHIRPSDWTSHGHGADPRYSRVIAHVCYYDGDVADGELPAGSIAIALKDPLKQNPAFSFEAIDVTAYPYAAIDSDQPPCAKALASLPPDEHEALLDSAGHERIRVKALRMQTAIAESGEEQSLYEETMGALGYKQNQRAFRALSRRLPLSALHTEAEGDPEKTYALLLGVGGLLPGREIGHDPETRLFLRRLWDHWWKRQSAWRNMIMPDDAWQTSGLRPQNQPVRRLAAAASLFSETAPLSDRVREVDPAVPSDWFARTGSLIEDLTCMDYWKRRLTFSGRITAAETSLVGRQRIAAILSNVIIPFLAATGSNVQPLLDRIPAEQDNALIRHTAHALFGRDHNPAFYRKGIRQQGLLQIFHDFCVNTRTGCPDCALAEALKSL